MKYYIGLDVSMKETSICVMDEAECIVYEGVEITHPDRLVKHINALNLNVVKIGIESGSLSHWLVSKMQEQKLPAICVDARHMERILSSNVNKTDKNDARGIANAMRCNMYRPVCLKSQVDLDICNLITARKTLVKECSRVKSSIRGILKTQGICIATTGKKAFLEKAREVIKSLPCISQGALAGLLNAFECIHEQILILETQIKYEAQNDSDVKLLMTIPGIGPITALSFKASIGDPTRFSDSRSVGAYLGMTPQEHSSGEVKRLGRISKCGAGELRSLLYEAAIVMLTRSKVWSKPKAWALKIQRKKGLKKAAVALGRKLAVVMHRMLITKETFRLGAPVQEKDILQKAA
jgi:transposase